ncbi:SPOR domain-containing protein [Ruegeria profundi]|uniref:Sporulation protein n=1 Tax=Ruegeria profundi TaxID=1685378 RepID=A0A0X3TW39_9RHOB|nr:SPOR domain-containing protein [Ruegeria profundi]KUJ79281.1 sporulation protein [Ruegeria profundi]
MKRATEIRANPRSLAVFAVALAVLTACDELPSIEEASADATDEDTQTDGTIELFPEFSDRSGDTIEAPDVFNVAEAGLWDGRPSLGGIWVAHPDVTQPERVVIKNTTNNKSVNGALFRRERNLPGPALQLSSAAAEELGILAGAPTKIEVVALRRKPVEEVPEPEETEVAEQQPIADEAEAQNEDVETAEAKEEKPAKRKWWQRKETVAAGAAAGAVAAGATAEVTEETTEAAAEATASTIEAAEEVVEATAQETSSANLSDPEITPPQEKPAKQKWWQRKKPDEITETPLDPIAGAAAAIDTAEPTSASATSAATQNTAPRSLTKPFVQVGTFNVEANAQSAAQKIERNGISADVRQLKSGDKTVWRVLVGPASSRAERNALQSDVRDLGFTDAYSVKN